MEAKTVFVWTSPKPELCLPWLDRKVKSTATVQFNNVCMDIPFNTIVMWYLNRTCISACRGMMAQLLAPSPHSEKDLGSGSTLVLSGRLLVCSACASSWDLDFHYRV